MVPAWRQRRETGSLPPQTADRQGEGKLPLIPVRTSVWNVLLTLAEYRSGRLVPCGTAFLVGKSLALTAAHLVEQPSDRRKGDLRKAPEPDFGIVAIQRIAGGRAALCWRVEWVYRFPAASEIAEDGQYVDAALLTLIPLPPPLPHLESWRSLCLPLNVAPPAIGARVTGFGLTEMTMSQSAPLNPMDPLDAMCQQARRRVEGEVTGVFFPRRDRIALPFPCFEVRGDFEPGMSGGPIVDERGEVCGIISRGGIPGVSYGCVLWPVLGIEIDGKFLLDIARAGGLRARNLHRVSVHPAPGFLFPDVSFDAAASEPS